LKKGEKGVKQTGVNSKKTIVHGVPSEELSGKLEGNFKGKKFFRREYERMDSGSTRGKSFISGEEEESVRVCRILVEGQELAGKKGSCTESRPALKGHRKGQSLPQADSGGGIDLHFRAGEQPLERRSNSQDGGGDRWVKKKSLGW